MKSGPQDLLNCDVMQLKSRRNLLPQQHLMEIGDSNQIPQATIEKILPTHQVTLVAHNPAHLVTKRRLTASPVSLRTTGYDVIFFRREAAGWIALGRTVRLRFTCAQSHWLHQIPLSVPSGNNAKG
jgi:hypothetical protein